ncbi:MAG: hypothetical protein PW791_10715 [Neorhizobium sp.]|nr:hypothetical protein [Neorhizobium sp.]
MALIGFKNTNNHIVYVNTDQVLYVTAFEPDVTILAMACAGHNGQPVALHVRGGVEAVQQRLSGSQPAQR